MLLFPKAVNEFKLYKFSCIRIYKFRQHTYILMATVIQRSLLHTAVRLRIKDAGASLQLDKFSSHSRDHIYNMLY